MGLTRVPVIDEVEITDPTTTQLEDRGSPGTSWRRIHFEAVLWIDRRFEVCTSQGPSIPSFIIGNEHNNGP